ncbi:cytochrome c oxidase assembly protein [Metabacillus sp. 113a]|uniref:cytochrome c oxidase assembly protein n=1 Tax=Metabacillus sp. 113a TaxID=3404706 RepID=UPI003CE919B4
MHHHYANPDLYLAVQILLALPFFASLVLYVLAASKQKNWPGYRIWLWAAGSAAALFSVAGPLAERALSDFTAHMISHLLLGMLAPVLMALAAPLTLVFRSVPVQTGRKLSANLRSAPIRWLGNPITASLLNIGGLWILYTTDLYGWMHQLLWLHILIHLHIFLAGYLFTISFIAIDPLAHRSSYTFRSIVLVLAFAGHGILSKYVYAHPPSGVGKDHAEIGGMLMYYGGDAIDIFIAVIFCFQWYKAARPRPTLHKEANTL